MIAFFANLNFIIKIYYATYSCTLSYNIFIFYIFIYIFILIFILIYCYEMLVIVMLQNYALCKLLKPVLSNIKMHM